MVWRIVRRGDYDDDVVDDLRSNNHKSMMVRILVEEAWPESSRSMCKSNAKSGGRGQQRQLFPLDLALRDLPPARAIRPILLPGVDRGNRLVSSKRGVDVPLRT
jgi:hypothetical protein